MASFEQDVTDILDGRVRMYRRANSGDNWHYRIWVTSAKKYIRKTTKTPRFNEAREIAEDAFHDMRAALRQDLPVFNKTFGELYALALIDEKRKLSRGDITPKRLELIQGYSKRYFLPYFKKWQITSITTKACKEYWIWREDYWKQPNAAEIKRKHNIRIVAETPSTATLYLEKYVLDMVIQKAIELGYISPYSPPNTTPPGKHKDNRRPALTLDQWRKMSEYLKDIYPNQTGSGMSDTKRSLRTMLYYYCTLLINTGMRISDARNLKWGNMSLLTDMNGEVSTHFQVYGKKKMRDVIALRELYDTMLEWRRNDANPYNGDDDHVFSRDDGTPLKNLSEFFDRMKQSAEKTEDFKGISTDYMGEKITIYSLRHSYACFQRMYLGTSFEDLSQNMGTGIEMLRRFYVDIKSTDIAGRLNKSIKGMTPPELVKTKEIVKRKLGQGMFGKADLKDDPMFRLLEGQISKYEYSELKRMGDAS